MGVLQKNGHLIQFGPFELDAKNAELRRKGVRTPIQPVAFKLLEMLVSRPNELISREEIRRVLWPQERVTKPENLDLRLNFEIKAIRQALADDHAKPRYIQTVRKRGYKFIAPLQLKRVNDDAQKSLEGNDQDEPRVDTVTESDCRNQRKNSPARNILVAGLIVLIVGLGLLSLKSRTANRPAITWVSEILPQPNQPIIIRGSGLGSYTNFTALDSPFLAIRDQTAHWAAGRIMERNWDKVTLTVTRWLNSEILVTGFCGSYGQNGWELRPGDEIEVAVWNPQTGAGPALYHLSVSAAKGGQQ
jgi:DNA-binding winged helix-turn-helix (wHTH) protein